LDLVESDHPEVNSNPDYRTTLVYGNLLIEPSNDGNSQICHYGGDNGDIQVYRKGTLHFYNNTVLSARTGNTTLFRLSSADETAEVRNNIFYATAGGNYLGILDNTGTVNLYNNWLSQNWKRSFSNISAFVNDVSGNITGDAPGWTDMAHDNFIPAPGSPVTKKSGQLTQEGSSHPPFFNPDAQLRPDYSTHRLFSESSVSGID